MVRETEGPGVGRPPVAVQRQGTAQPPSLFSQPDPASKYRLGGDMQLKLSPELLAMMQRHVDEQLDAAKLKPALGKVNYAGPSLPKVPTPAQAAGGAAGQGTPGPHPAVDPKSVPPVPQPEPIVPRGAGPDQPKQGELSDVAEAIAGIPAVEQALTTLKTEAKTKITNDWGKLNTGEKAAVVTSVVSIGIGALGGAATDPAARKLLLSQLNGKILPVPGVSWLNVELNTGEGNMMVGMHVDVGRLLPPSWGFGPGSPSAIGGPPQPEPSPWQRTAATPGVAAPGAPDEVGDLSRRLLVAASRGAPLPTGIRERFEGGLGADLSQVRIHTGGEADRLARAVDATAFTTGQDIFFRAGAYSPGTTEGLRLLAHETTHAVQQAAGPVSGVARPGGIALSEPGDSFERAADRAAASLVTLAPAATAGRLPGHDFSRLGVWR